MIGVGGVLGMLLYVELRTYTKKIHINSQNDKTLFIFITMCFGGLTIFHGIFFILILSMPHNIVMDGTTPSN